MNGIPLYALFLTYVVFALIFPDRWNYILGSAFCLMLWLASRSIGRRVFAHHSSIPDSLLFPAGLGIILAAATILSSFSTAHWVIVIFWILLAAASFFDIQYLEIRLPLKYIFFAPLLLLAFWSSFTPTTFFDALSYHLGLPY